MSANPSPVRVLALLCIAGATMLFTSAGNADPAGVQAYEGTGFTQDPCSLLTDDEVSQQLGRQVRAMSNRDHEPMCEWTPDGRPGLDTWTFLEYQKLNSRLHLDVVRDLKRANAGPGIRRIDIGDGALLSIARRDITVLVGGSTFRISGGGAISLTDDALINLARLAQPRAH